MGSRVYARRCQEHGEKIVAMLSVETIGYCSLNFLNGVVEGLEAMVADLVTGQDSATATLP